jgi:hypothetical protein
VEKGPGRPEGEGPQGRRVEQVAAQQVNYVLLHLHLAGKHDLKPTHDELKDWLRSGQVDVLRMKK